MTQTRSRFLGKEFWISETSSENAWRGTIRGKFKEDDEWFYEVESAEGRTVLLTANSIVWMEPVKRSKKEEIERIKTRRSKKGIVLRLIK